MSRKASVCWGSSRDSASDCLVSVPDPRTLGTEAELGALTQALHWSKDKSVTIYTESRYSLLPMYIVPSTGNGDY